MHFNLDNKEYLFTIIEKRRKKNNKKRKCVTFTNTFAFAFIYSVVACACLSERSDDTCIKTSTRLSAIWGLS